MTSATAESFVSEPQAPRSPVWLTLLNYLVIMLLGGLMIFSGLIKINDPIGTALKMEEYFEVFANRISPFFHAFVPFALHIGIAMCVLEVVLGLALLINYRRIPTLWLLLLLMIFFSFLTFYSAYTDAVRDCGCFGTFIQLKPWHSFYKDLVLDAMILFLLVQPRIMRNDSSALTQSTVLGGLVLSVLLAVLAVMYMPYLDFMPYAVGKSIIKQSKPEKPPIFQYIMTKDGKDIVFDKYPTDKSYKFKEMVTLNPEESTPKISDFVYFNDSLNFTADSLKGKQLFVIIPNFNKADRESFVEINKLAAASEKAGIQVIALMWDDGSGKLEEFKHDVQLAATVYMADGTLLKTMARTNPCLLYLNDGLILGKWGHRKLPGIEDLLTLNKN
ncbi:MAG: DoxX family protein [Cytophagales bacterium]|nr:MAG: DoxX family protein [Cytophagales bacterium]TAF61679.1 MAG: DoxX family protein [Cytophagales bacterium]